MLDALKGQLCSKLCRNNIRTPIVTLFKTKLHSDKQAFRMQEPFLKFHETDYMNIDKHSRGSFPGSFLKVYRALKYKALFSECTS